MRISGEKTMRVPGGGDGEQTIGLALPPCPVCQTPGVPGEEFCPECGFLVGSTPGRQPGAPAQKRPSPKLIDEQGREFVLQPGENVVGREGADILLPNRTVSRRHALLRVAENGAVTVEDTRSTNGTKCGGVKLVPETPVAVSDGVTVQFGEVRLTAVIPPATAPSPASGRPLPAIPSAYDAVPEAPPPPLALIPPSTGAVPPTTGAARLIGSEGTLFPLGDGGTSFGRRPTNSYVLSGDSYVSGAHAVIEQENGRFYLMDMGSTNGTRLNGRRIAPNHPEPLSEGDEILMGQTPFTFHLGGG